MRITNLRLLLTLLSFSALGFTALAQTTQDCLGAVDVCQEVYESSTPPLGTGDFSDEITAAQTCMAGEINSIWFSFTAEQDGDLGFLITPENADDDYDWALFDITNATCADVGTDPSILVSCNAAGGAGCHGATGMTATGIGNDTGAGCAGTGQLNELVPAVVGQTFVLLISNWTGSTSGYSLDFTESTIFNSFDDPPSATGFSNTCTNGGNGYIEIQGEPGETYDYTVLDDNGDVVYECFSCSGLVTTDADLPAGGYSILAVIVGEDCELTAAAVVEDDLPTVTANIIGIACESEGVNLTANVQNAPPGASVAYQWIGPDFDIYIGQMINAPDEGTYMVRAEVDGCLTEFFEIEVTFLELTTSISGLNEVCHGEQVALLASGDGNQFSWLNLDTNENLGTDNPIILTLDASATIQVTATDGNSGCSTTDEYDVIINPLPQLTIDITGSLCANEPVTLTASGLDDGFYEWEDDPSAPNPRILTNLDPGTHLFVVTGTAGTGCSSMTDIFFNLQAVPDVTFDVSPDPVCDGEMATITLTGTGINMIDWGGIAPANQNPITLTINGNTMVEAAVTNGNNCTEFFNTNILPAPSPAPTVISCGMNTPNSVTFNWTPVTGATSYTVTVAGQASQTTTNTSLVVDNLMPGETVMITVQPTGGNICLPESTTFSCTTQACPSINLVITPVDLICLGDVNVPLSLMFTADDMSGIATWSGNGIIGVNDGTFDPQVAGVGDHVITIDYPIDDCIYSAMMTIMIRQQPTSDFTITPTEACINDDATITYNGTAGAMATYTWNFNGGVAVPGTGVGPHTVNWPTGGNKTVSLTVSENGCVSNSTPQMISVLSPIAAPVINCAPSTSDIVFSWNAVTGASSYIVNLISAPPGATTVYDDIALTYTVSGLNANESVEIQVIAVDDGPCPNSSANQTCVAENCPAVMIDIDPVAPICLDANASTVNLNAVITGGAGGGSEFWSGTGITDTLGVFDPTDSEAGTWTVNVTYTEGNCQYNASLEIVVNAQPTANFTVDTALCQTGTATAIYTGSASAGVGTVYDWNFGTATAVPGTGVGPHTLSWPASGMQGISLTVTENNCASEPFNASVQVDEPLTIPEITCDATTTTVTFSWAVIPNATGYMVNEISIPPAAVGVYDDVALTYTVSGLVADESVEVEVVALGDGACGNSSQTFSCVAQNCPIVTIDIDPVNPICLNANASIVNLNAVIAGGAGGGSEFWSGTGITDTLGVFDPNDAGAGDWTITVIYTEGICEYTETIDITVNAQPSADFMIDNVDVCEQQPVTITYTGAAAVDAIYNWDFDDGAAIPGTGQGPHTVTWATGSMPNISLTVIENNCSSPIFNEMLSVADSLIVPVINCNSDNTTLTFSWNPVVGATSYTVDVINEPAGASGIFDDVALTYSYTNLTPGDEITIQVNALTDSPCGGVSTEMTCMSEPCDDLTFQETIFGPYCTDEGLQNLSTSIGTNNGTFTWSGAGVDNAVATFDPSTSGTGMIPVDVQYELTGCFFDTTFQIVVNAVPTASFTVDSPICVENTATLTFDGSASAAAVYSWDLDGGMIESGVDPGPYTVAWDAAGDYMITLNVTDNGCASNSFSLPVMVDAVIAPPVVNCDSDNTTLTFSWNPVIGATGYTVDVINEPAGASGLFDDAALTYSYTNLTPGDEITIQVNVLTDSPCGGVSTEMTCMSEPCDDLTFQETVFGPYCTDEGLQNLSTSIGTNNGTFTWSGAGVDNAAATFDPSTSGTGMIPVDVQYELTGCFFDTTFQVVVNAVPTASFTVDSPICVENTATLTFDGSASVAAVYSWDLDGGMIESGVDPGPYTVTWDAAGDYMITLNVTDNGCASNSFSLPVMVDAVIAPVEIICQTTSSTSVTFAWDPVAGADTYDVTVVAGPMGVQTGNTYTMTGLVPDEVVTIEVTASGSSVCGPSTAMGTCIAQACQSLTLAIDGSPTLCVGDDGQINFDFTTNQAGPFEVTYTVNGTQEQMIFDGDGMIALDNLTANTTVEVISIMDVNITECIYPGGQMWDIQVDQMAEAGQVTGSVDLCEGEVQVIDLNTLLTGADANGVWTETSTPSSTGGGFNATAGNFNTAGQAAQAYSFVYTIAGGACPDDSAETAVAVAPVPVADAGDNQMLTCVMGTATLGGNGSTPGETYQWTSTNPDAIIADPMDQFTEISSPGDYTLEVTNAAGCSSTDEVAVSAAFDVPVADVSISDPTCFEANDGNIIIDNVSGGVAPYTYSLNGGDMSSNTFFGNLNPGEYSLIVQGGNDCFTELFINIAQPEEVVVELVANIQNGDNIINLGETVVLEALYSPSINVDTVIWKPDTLDTEALNIINVTPQQTSTYTVTLIDANGCADSDDMTIIVQKPRPVYIPTAFSPDDSGSNDMFFIDGGSQIKQVKSFLIFNRWGESVFENRDFFAGDPSQGWDGKHRGQILNPAVFVYFVEVEFIDGEVILYKGDVMLMR